MVKIFALNDHHELEQIVNHWIQSHNILISDIKYTVTNSDDILVYTVLIVYQSDTEI